MDCAYNIITANFSGGKTHATTARVYQWSRGIELCITGADNLPQTFKAHFSVQKKGGVATTIVGIDERVDVPNVLFTIGKDIHVWLGASETADDAEILYTVDIPVAPAPMPEYYDAEDTGVFDAVVEQVSGYAATATAAANNAGASASAAAASATAAAGSANSASASAASAATNASRAEVARSEAEAAQASASAAAATATDKAAEASASATAAGQSASDAVASKTAAANAATAAGQSASAAGNSATTAITKASEAAASASDAAQSATAAAGSATTASTAAQAATTKAGESSASATAAEAAKTAAQTAQTAAETAATNAGQSASTATAKASEAATSASGAAQSKTDAEAAAARAEAAAASLTVDSALSDSSTNPVQNKVITGELTDVKSAITKKADIASITGQLIAGKKSKTVSSAITILSEKNPVNVVSDFSAQKVVVHGRNRFNLDTASFAFSGYSGSQTLTKDADSITIECNVSNASAYLYAYTTYTAEFNGDLFVSCEADTTGNIADVCVLVQLNGTSQTRLYGRGFLYEKITVAKGDAVRLMFYTHMGTTAYNTVTYKNIQLAYGGLYEYTPYKEDVTNEILVEKTLTLPATADAYILATTADSAYKWVKLKAEYNTIPARLRPANNDAVADITVTGLPLVTYNQTYNMTIGLGLSSAGTLGIYNDQNRTSFITWLTDNPVTITFMDCDGYEKLTDYTFTQGEIIELETAQDITYYYDESAPTDKIVCFGDSITGMFGNKCGYPAMLELLHGYDAVNIGFSGCRWTDHSNANYRPFCMNRLAEAISSGDYSAQDASPFVNTSSASYNPLYAEHLENLKTLDWGSVDYVTMFWGTNDWGDGAILRSADDPSADTKQRTNVEDAIKYSINQIVSKYPWVKVIVITPYWRSITSGNDSNVDPNSNGAYLYDWSEFIGEVAQDNFNIPVIALYRTLGANALTNRYFTQDGTHPTEMTKRIIADRIAATVEIY